MRYIRQMGFILLFSFLGNLLSSALPFRMPAAIYGLLLMFLALQSGTLSLKSVEETGEFLVEIMPVLFVAPTVSIIESWDVIQNHLGVIIIIISVSTILAFGISGKVTQKLIQMKAGKSFE